MQASVLEQKRYNSAHTSRPGTHFMYGIVMLLLEPTDLLGQVAHKHN